MATMIGRASTIFLLFHVNVGNAYINGAGSCDAGVPVQGSHVLNEQLGGGPLSDNGFQVKLNGATLDSESQNDVPISETAQQLQLVAAAENTFFRGFLVRIEGDGVDTTEYLDIAEGDEEIRIVSLCVIVEGVGGVSHTNNDPKTEATALLRLPEVAMNLRMDVTMVVQNRDGQAEWYNSRYILNAGGATVAPTISHAPSPVPTITSLPTVSPQPTDRLISSQAPSVLDGTAMPSDYSQTETSSSGKSSLLFGSLVSCVFVLATLLV